MYTYSWTAEFGPKWFVYDPYLSQESNFISMTANLALKTFLMTIFHMWKLHKWVKFMCENYLFFIEN